MSRHSKVIAQTDTQTHTQTDRHTDGHTHRQYENITFPHTRAVKPFILVKKNLIQQLTLNVNAIKISNVLLSLF